VSQPRADLSLSQGGTPWRSVCLVRRLTAAVTLAQRAL